MESPTSSTLMIIDIKKNNDPEFPVQLIYSVYKHINNFVVLQTYTCIHNLKEKDLTSTLEELKARENHKLFLPAKKECEYTWEEKDAIASKYFGIEK